MVVDRKGGRRGNTGRLNGKRNQFESRNQSAGNDRVSVDTIYLYTIYRHYARRRRTAQSRAATEDTGER